MRSYIKVLFLILLWGNIATIYAATTTSLQNIALGKSYTLDPAPNYELTKDPLDKTKLTDGVYTKGFFWTQKSTAGWRNARPVVITIDLGKIEPIRGVSYNTAAGASDVTWPTLIGILVSDDGKFYYNMGNLITLSTEHGLPPKQGYGVFRYWTDALHTHGRYVKLVIDANGPYAFTDEVEVYRGDASWIKQSQTSSPITNTLDYFFNETANILVKNRLQQDIQDAREMTAAAVIPLSDKKRNAQEINALEKQLTTLPPMQASSFQAILPLNKLEAHIFSLYGKTRHLQGYPELQAWINNPYDPLTPTQNPDTTIKKLHVYMMHNEWRSATLNLTNSSEKPITTHISLQGLPNSVNTKLISAYNVTWTLTKAQIPIASALVPLALHNGEYTLTIPAGMTQQIWFSFHAIHVPSGDYNGTIHVTYNTNNSLPVIPIELQIFPLYFPNTPTLHLGGWDYTDRIGRYGVTRENRNLLINCLKEHFIDSPWAGPGTLAMGTFSSTNEMLPPSTEIFDQWIALWPNVQRYCISISTNSSISEKKINTPEFKKRVQSWINFWVNHIKKQGILPQQLVILIVDEPHQNSQDQIITAWANAIHEVQPQIMVWEDPTYVNPQNMLPKMLDSINILTINRNQLLKNGTSFIKFYEAQHIAGHPLELYACQGPMELLDPYSYIRMQAWNAWGINATGTNFWSFSDTGGGNLWQPWTIKTNYSPIFLTPTSVTSSKQGEAIRESIEDYEYFVILQTAMSKARRNNIHLTHAHQLLSLDIQNILTDVNMTNMSWFSYKNRWKADWVRLDILKTIVLFQEK